MARTATVGASEAAPSRIGERAPEVGAEAAEEEAEEDETVAEAPPPGVSDAVTGTAVAVARGGSAAAAPSVTGTAVGTSPEAELRKKPPNMPPRRLITISILDSF